MSNLQEAHKELIKKAFRNTVEAQTLDDEQIARYFDASYIQHVDGTTIGYKQFVDHLYAQRKTVSSMKITFLNLACEGDIVFSNHTVTILKKDGTTIKAKVLAQFTIKDNKIIACDELTHIVGGTQQDKDLGSRH